MMHMHPNVEQNTIDFVKHLLNREPSGHDWYHAERVWLIAKFLQRKEGGSLFEIELAALLHNVKEHHYANYTEKKATLTLEGIMDTLQISAPLQQKILTIIDESKYQADETKTPTSIEGQILQDANWLDALGAVGIARAFASGGHFDRPIYDPNRKVRVRISKEEYMDKRRTTSFNYIIEKSLALSKRINTPTAREIAKNRIAFTQKFIQQFELEVQELDIEESENKKDVE